MAKKMMWGLLLGVVILKVILMLTAYYIDHDIFVHLDIAIRLLDGARPYIDYIETNFPTAHYLHIPPVFLAQITPLSISRSFYIYIGLMSFVSAGTCFYLIWKFNQQAEEDYFFLALGLPTALLFVDYMIFESYGQREHIFMLMFLPFVILMWLRWNHFQGVNRYLGFVIGLIAGIGLTIKPYFFVLLLVMVLFWLFSRRNWRFWYYSEWWGMVVAGVCYILFALLNWSSTEAFLFDQIPETLENYWVYGHRGHVLWQAITVFNGELILCGVLLVVGAWSYRKHAHIASLMILWGLLLVGSLIVVDLQDKAWHYHYVPFQIFGYLSIIILTAFFIPRVLKKDILPAQIIVMVLLLVLTRRIDHQIFASATESITHSVEVIQQNSDEDEAVMGISISVIFSRLIVLAERENATTHLSAHPLAFELAKFRTMDEIYSDEVFDISEEIQKYLDILMADVANKQPRLIFIDDRCDLCPRWLTISDYLDGVGFIDYIIQQGYQEQAMLDERFVIYKR